MSAFALVPLPVDVELCARQSGGARAIRRWLEERETGFDASRVSGTLESRAAARALLLQPSGLLWRRGVLSSRGDDARCRRRSRHHCARDEVTCRQLRRARARQVPASRREQGRTQGVAGRERRRKSLVASTYAAEFPSCARRSYPAKFSRSAGKVNAGDQHDRGKPRGFAACVMYAAASTRSLIPVN